MPRCTTCGKRRQAADVLYRYKVVPEIINNSQCAELLSQALVEQGRPFSHGSWQCCQCWACPKSFSFHNSTVEELYHRWHAIFERATSPACLLG